MTVSTNNIMTNLAWRLSERFGARLVEFVVSIILARLLVPHDYGVIALVTVFISVLQVFIDNGLGNALIQKKDAESIDYSTVFYTNLVFCFILYSILFVLSPLVAIYFNDPIYTKLLRILGITILISGVKNIQQSYVSRHMLFKKFFFATLGGTIIAAASGIILAYHNFGVWSLVAQQIINVLVDTIILWFTVKWRPTKEFSFSRLKTLFSFGWKILISSLLDTVYLNIRQIVIGKLYSSSDLAFYNRGRQFPSFLVTNINSSIDSVLFPALSNEQDNVKRVKEMTRWSIKISTYIMAPLMMGLAFAAKPIVDLLLTEKWLECIPYLRIFCITFMFYPIQTANLNAIKALGRSDIYLKLEIMKKVVGLIILIATMRFGVLVIAYSMLAMSFISQIINSWPNKALLSYSYIEQIQDIVPYILISVVMGFLIVLMPNLGLSNLFTVCLQIIVGFTAYILLSRLFHFESYYFLMNTLKNIKKSKIESE